jgi:hypothetical protein
MFREHLAGLLQVASLLGPKVLKLANSRNMPLLPGKVADTT